MSKISNCGRDFQLWSRFPTLAKISNFGRDFQLWPRFPILAKISNFEFSKTLTACRKRRHSISTEKRATIQMFCLSLLKGNKTSLEDESAGEWTHSSARYSSCWLCFGRSTGVEDAGIRRTTQSSGFDEEQIQSRDNLCWSLQLIKFHLPAIFNIWCGNNQSKASIQRLREIAWSNHPPLPRW
jgi:hypothetical protein